jgi:dTDP-4-amino-4,6-dideoxygalactose transaminase
MKIAIIYRGNIRGFKYDECFKTHEKLYNVLKNNNIDFDTYLCTNNIEYDETSINKIENLKSKYILDINNVRSDNKYKQAFSNIKFLNGRKQEFMEKMKDANVMTSQVHNRNDINSCVKDFEENLPNIDLLEKELVCIPVGWWLEEKDIEYIINNIRGLNI